MSLPAKSNKPVEIFYSYSHKDEKLRNRLETHLSLLKQQGLVINWHDRMISAGKEWQKEINHYLNSAHIILLLISPDFLASGFCYSIEMKRAVERHERGEARVIPIILRPVYWENSPFSMLEALPKDGKAITTWANRDEAFLDVTRGIQKAIKELQVFASQNIKAEKYNKSAAFEHSARKEGTLQDYEKTQHHYNDENDPIKRAIVSIPSSEFAPQAIVLDEAHKTTGYTPNQEPPDEIAKSQQQQIKAYYVFEDIPINYAKIHFSTCRFCNDGKGFQPGAEGVHSKWHGLFSTMQLAKDVAHKTGRKVEKCKICNPD